MVAKKRKSKKSKFLKRLPQDVYSEHRKHLIDAGRGQAQLFDRSIITLTGAALGLSFAFIKDIVPNPDPKTLYLLHVAWAGFVFSLLLTLTSFQLSQYAYRRERENLDKRQRGEIPKESVWKNWGSRLTLGANILSNVIFIAAAAFLLIFTAYNL